MLRTFAALLPFVRWLVGRGLSARERLALRQAWEAARAEEEAAATPDEKREARRQFARAAIDGFRDWLDDDDEPREEPDWPEGVVDQVDNGIVSLELEPGSPIPREGARVVLVEVEP